MILLKQEAGLAQLLIEEIGLELIHRIDRPALPGDVFSLRCVEVMLFFHSRRRSLHSWHM